VHHAEVVQVETCRIEPGTLEHLYPEPVEQGNK
jgi:hypothetical protein